MAILIGLVLWIPLIAAGFNPVWMASLSALSRALLFAVPLALFLVIIWFVWADFIKPWLYLRVWLLEMHAGNLSARVPDLENSGLKSLCDDLNSLAKMLEKQSNHAEQQLREHTKHIAEKSRLLNEESVRLSVMEERTWLANELHDSLAQTVSSLRFQVRVLDQSLHEGNEATTWQNLERVENSLEEANREVRNLIEYFKGTATMPGLAALDQFVVQFQRDNSDIKVFLDNKHWTTQNLPEEYTSQVFRIIQEAVANARKHGKANFIRIFMRSDSQGEHFVLIEDSGIGMTAIVGDDQEKHFGLAVMRERAASIGGHLDIESEAGEGVRVTLHFHYAPVRSNE